MKLFDRFAKAFAVIAVLFVLYKVFISHQGFSKTEIYIVSALNVLALIRSFSTSYFRAIKSVDKEKA